MAKKAQFTKAQVAAALDEADGSRVAAADALGCNVRTIFRYQERYPELKKIADAGDQRITDLAKSRLVDMIRDGQPGAIMFWLKCRAGWSERAQVELSGNLAHTVRHDPPPRAQTLEEWCSDRRRQVQEALEA